MDKDMAKDQSFADVPNYEEELVSVIKSNASDDEIREKLDDYHENDVAGALELLTVDERKKLYQILGIDRVSEIFAYLDDVGKYIGELEIDRAADIIEKMDADDAVDALEDVEEDKREQLIYLIDKDAKQDINLIFSYNDDEIGSKMTTNFIKIEKDLSIKQAMKSLILQAKDNDNISTIYVYDHDNKFYGALQLNDLIIAREYTSLEDLVSKSYPYVLAHELIPDCIERLKDYAEDSIPVLDDNNTIIGVITSQDVVEVVDTEMGEDYAKLAGLTNEEDLHEPLIKSIRKRMPWLIILLFLGMVVSSTIGLFEAVVSQLTLIVCFQSLILDMAGNVGTQSLAVTIRVLMDENLGAKQKIALVLKEVRVGTCNGLILGVLSCIFTGLYIWLFKATPPLHAFAISACVGLALMIAMAVSSFVGTTIPMLFHKMGVDPAVASGPLITTVNDLVAVIIYYGTAWILLINIMHMVS